MADKKLFTASEARELAGKTLDEKIESLCETIKRLATAKKRQCRTGYDHTADQDLWQNGGYSHTEEYTQACKKLESLGYTVEFFYEERQFVDMYTLIKW